MPLQLPPRLPAAAATVLAAGLMLTAGCSHLTPLGPDPAATIPQPHHLRSPFVLESMRTQQAAPGGGCPAGFTKPSAPVQGPGCYRPLGAPVTITTAAVSPVSSFQQPVPPGQQAGPLQYGFWITLPAADAPTVAAVIPTAPGHAGPPTARVAASSTAVPAISVAHRTWVLVGFSTRLGGRQLEVFLPSRNQALQLQRMLAASG